ncbi:MAG TPA: RecQ family ATP-dependent DNA helicase, partial [Xanthomonadales bacterium]|nr:RecQ family ATP-dependent DNA helicase [Xanthomonadales bacterium]
MAIDLEVGRNTGRIEQLAALRADTGDTVVFPPGTLQDALGKMDALSDGAAFVIGHNLIAFDLPHLRAVDPNRRLLNMPVIDTLRLSPLAFPRNPYHHLVKHYQDGQLLGDRRNNPLLDAELALLVFRDQEDALKAMQDAAPDRLLAWHWLTTRDDTASGLDWLFMTVRRARVPSLAEAQAAIARLLAGVACHSASTRLIEQVAVEPTRVGWPLAY